MKPTMIELPWTLDTNVLVYAFEPDQSSPKCQIAKTLLARLYSQPQACIVGQVVGEYLNVAIRKKAMTRAVAMGAANMLSRGARVLGASTQAYEQAWTLVGDHQYQVWDALIIAVCAEHGVKTLYSEDTGSLKRPLGVHVINPFAELEAA